MSDDRFERALGDVLRQDAPDGVPEALRMRVLSVPDRANEIGRFHGRIAGVAARAGGLALVVVVLIAAASVWLHAEGGAGIGGQPLAIRTEPAYPTGFCSQALLGSVRIERSGSQLVFEMVTTAELVPIVWPYGYSARVVDGRAELLAADGSVVGREGDVLEQLGGGLGANDIFHVCAVGDRA